MCGLGFWELAIIFLVAFLVLGPKRLPDLAKGLGKGLRDLRKASSDLRSSIADPLEELRKPLEEIRRPLEDIRSDLMGTMVQVRRELEEEVRSEAPPTGEPEASSGPPEDPELEARRREVEELYAAADEERETLPALEDEASDSSGAGAPGEAGAPPPAPRTASPKG